MCKFVEAERAPPVGPAIVPMTAGVKSPSDAAPVVTPNVVVEAGAVLLAGSGTEAAKVPVASTGRPLKLNGTGCDEDVIVWNTCKSPCEPTREGLGTSCHPFG